MPLPSYLAVGQWNDTSGRFFNLEDRLAGQDRPLTLPRPIYMPEYSVVNTTVMGHFAISEAYIRERFLELFRTCRPHGDDEFLFVDSGSNEGSWSLLAAAHGCKVVAIDPQPLCIELLRVAATRSGFDNIDMYNHILAPHHVNVSLNVPSDQCHGTSQYVTHLRKVSDVTLPGRSHLARRRSAPRHAVSAKSLDELVGPRRTVSLWHLDVEGAEVPVLRSARRLFAERRIRRVVLEFIPARWPAHNLTRTGPLPELARLFAGWQCHVICPFGGANHHKQPVSTSVIKPRTTCRALHPLCSPIQRSSPSCVWTVRVHFGDGEGSH